MKILITTDWNLTDINGVAISVSNLYNELINMGHDVRILTLSKSIHSHKEDHIYYIKSIPFNVYPNVRISVLLFDELFDELVDWKPDVIHSQCEFFTYTYAKIIAKRSNAPIVHTYHTMYEDYSEYLRIKKEFGKYVVAFMSKARLRDATIVIAPTNKVRNKLKDYDITQDIKVIPSGIDLSKFNIEVTKEDILEFRNKYQIPESSKILLYLGRLGKEKNLIQLLDYFKQVVEDKDDIILLLVGGGPFQSEVEKEIKKLGLEHKVKMTGMVKPSEVPMFYKYGDIFVSASQSETQGLTYIEAMSNGLPQVCKFDECLENVLIEGENGYFFESGIDFKEKILKILYNENLYEEMSTKALEKSKHFSKEVFAHSVLNLYKLATTMHRNKPKIIDLKTDEIWRIFNFRKHMKRIRRLF